MKKLFLIISLLFLIANNILADNYIQIPPPHQNNFHLAKQSLDSFLNKFDTLPKGWKQFKRAEAFWQNRVFPNGNMSSASFLLNEICKFDKKSFSNLTQRNWIDLSDFSQYKLQNRLQSETRFWEPMGPNIVVNVRNYSPDSAGGNGRINRIICMPNNDSTILVGAASGGIWKSTDAGETWRVIPFTNILSCGILDIAIAPSDTNIMFATTGDASGWNLFKTFSVGILKSTDAGETWKLSNATFNLSDSVYCGRIVIHPENPNIVYAATSQSILKTEDGGNTWTETLGGYAFRDLKFNPNNPNIIYATTFSYDEPSYIFVTEDGGEKWFVSKSLPDACRIELAVTPDNPELVYAVSAHKNINYGMEGLYVSRSNGLVWDTLMHISKQDNYINLVTRQAFYNLAISVSPADDKIIFVGGVTGFYSKDAGKSWISIQGNMHVDVHSFTFSNNSDKIYVANDGGLNWVYIDTLNNLVDTNVRWNNITNGLNITQYYRLGAHPYSTKYLLAGAQDNGSHSYENSYWVTEMYGDGMQCQFHPKDLRNKIFSSQRGGGFNYSIVDHFPWITEFTINPITPDSILIAGTNVWLKDIQNNNLPAKRISDFPKVDNNNEVRKIAVTTLNKNYIYASTTNRLYATKDYGESWKELYNTSATIVAIEVSPENPSIIWTGHSGHYENEKVLQFTGNIIKNLSYNLPNVSVNALVFYNKENKLFAGTDIGIFSLNLNDTVWRWFNNELPNISVNDLEYTEGTGYLYAATWGRGIWRCKLHDCPDAHKPVLNLEGEYSFCNPQKERLKLYVKNKIDGYKYLWNNGETKDTILTEAGTFYAISISPTACTEVSEECIVSYKDDNVITTKPTVKLLTRNPVCPGKTAKYQCNIKKTNIIVDFSWSNGSKDSIAEFNEDGASVELYYTYASGCRDTLIVDTVRYLPTPSSPKIIQKQSLLICEDTANYYEWYLNGEVLYDNKARACRIFEPGIYYVVTYDTNFCTAKSNEIIIDFDKEEQNKLIQAKITPNPNNGKFVIELYSGQQLNANIQLTDIEGKLISNFNCFINHYFHRELDFSTLSSNVYFIKISSKDYNRVKKIVIEK